MRPLEGHRPLWLDDPDTAWILTAGRAQVFGVELVDGTPAGPRRPLFAVADGEALLPAPPGSPLALVVVGIENGTTARPLAVSELRDARGIDAAEAADVVETWLDALAGAVDHVAPQDVVALEPGRPADLPAGAAVHPQARMAWIPAGAALAPYDEPLVDPAPDLVLPLPAQAWARATDALQTTPIAGADALGDPAGWAGVEALERTLLHLLHRTFSARDERIAAQIDERLAVERRLRDDTYTNLAAILGGRRASLADGDEAALFAAARLVGKQLGVEIVRPPASAADTASDPVETIARASGVRMRRVVLDRSWWRSDSGPLIATRAADGSPVALLQPRAGAYDLVDPADGARTRVDEQVAATLSPTATMFYRALPVVPVTGREVLAFVLRPLRGDLSRLAVYGLAAAALSLVTPIVTKRIFSDVVPGLQEGNLLWYAILLAVFAVATFGFAVAQQLALTRVEARAAGELQAALWDRVLDLPLPFFRRFSAGALTIRVMGIDQIRTLANAAVATAMLAVPLGLANLVLAFFLQWRLALFGSVVIVAIAGGLVALVRYQVTRQQLVQQTNQELFGTAMELVDGVGKLRVADAERRGFVQWARRFGAMKRSFYDAQLGFVALTSATAAATALATALLFAGAATLGVGAIDGATFIAFNAAFLQALTAVVGLSTVATFVAQAVPIYDNVRPVLEAARESESIRTDPGELRGQIDVAHLSMRYDVDAPLALDDVSISIAPGEFVAVVGPSGSGKTTLMRVLLGFERPEVGTVRLDGKDIESLDPRAVRRQIGVVLQSANLLPGDVFTNVIGTRDLTMDDAWEALRTAGLEDDIKALPMGMHTFIAEGASTFSGGQRQRLLIARAVAGRPRILLFDEATSALDNRTQAEVSAAIGRLRATRIVIAHRLSTVRHADRILVLVGGRVVQEGTFDALMDTPGPFQDLARRQLV